MKHWLIFFLILRFNQLVAQTSPIQLGTLQMLVTTPDSLNKSEFTEDDQSYVKGTIALPCTHIRSFKAARAVAEEVFVSDVNLYFYDNRLFKLSCEYSVELERVFTKKYGAGTPKPVRRVVLCSTERPLVLKGTLWKQDDLLALVVQSSGYTAACEPETRRRLIIADLRLQALASDCELNHADPSVDAFLNGLP